MTDTSEQENEPLLSEIERENAQQSPIREPLIEGEAPKKKEFLVSVKTREMYQKMVELMTRRIEASRSSGMSDWVSITPLDLVKDLSERDDLKDATVNTYIYALAWHFTQYAHLDIFQDASKCLLEFSSERKRGKSMARAQASTTTSNRPWKRRAIPEQDMVALVDELTNMSSGSYKSIWAARAQRWMLAGLATGIRPGEWAQTSWVDESKQELEVVNGKIKVDTPGFLRESREDEKYVQTLPVTRRIPVEGDADRMIIDSHMQSISENVLNGQLSMDDYRKRCRVYIARACEKIWDGKKIYSLSSARKQFSANKRAELGAVTTAKLMGHSRADTPAASFYGTASQAYSRTGAKRQQKKLDLVQKEGSLMTAAPALDKTDQGPIDNDSAVD